jgi:metal-responsive CopG/Arc/MetJ family transcriptional regulator
VSLSNRCLDGPRTGITPLTGLRTPAELTAKLDAWIERQSDPEPSRSKAIRRLLERALEGD